MARCVCIIQGDNINGVLTLSQVQEDAPTVIQGEITGLTPGQHGIHVHIFGDISQGFSSCGGIFNPFGKQHGDPSSDERMSGDLGNVIVDDDGLCNVHISDRMVKLIGPHSIIGRSILIKADEDDLGRGGHELSLTTGNSGTRIAGGVVGIAST